MTYMVVHRGHCTQASPVAAGRRGVHCRAVGGNKPPATSQDAVLARINKAKEYKQKLANTAAPTAATTPPPVLAASPAAAAPPPAPPGAASAAAPQPPPLATSSTGNDEQVLEVLGQWAEQEAAKEAASFLEAMAAVPVATPAAQQPAPPPAATQAAVPAATQAAAPAASSAASPSSSSPSSDSSGGDGSATAAEVAEAERSFRTGVGNADQAANWLQLSNSGPSVGADSELSAEQFTLAKDALQRQQDVQIITVDAGYAARLGRKKRRQQRADSGEEEEEEEEEGEDGEPYRPQVDTWGVFPRPKNISEAYGGGRTLRPGQALESEEEAAARKLRVAAALQSYRKTLGLDVDPEMEARAQSLYNEGMGLFDAGLISLALEKFSSTAELTNKRTRLGGESRLQQAICLDSLGRNSEAYTIYCSIEGHFAPGVAKKVKRMLFGFRAAESLKVTNLSYSPTSDQWERYFDRINSGSLYNNSFVAPEGENSDSASQAMAVAASLAVIAAPLAFLALKVLH